MAGFTITMEARTIFIIARRRRGEDITTNATTNIATSMIASVMTVVGNEIQNQEE